MALGTDIPGRGSINQILPYRVAELQGRGAFRKYWRFRPIHRPIADPKPRFQCGICCHPEQTANLTNLFLENRALIIVAIVRGTVFTAYVAPQQENLIVSWATSEQIPELQNALPEKDMADKTLRQIAFPENLFTK